MLTSTQYQILLDLYHERNEEFTSLSHDQQEAFYAHLYNPRLKFKDSM